MNRPSLQLLPSRTSSAVVLDLPVDRTAEVIRDFIRNQNSPGTRSVYGSELGLFFKFTGKRAGRIQSSDLLTYKDSLQGLRPATISRKLTTLRAFFSFAVAEGIIDRDPTVNLKLPKVAGRR